MRTFGGRPDISGSAKRIFYALSAILWIDVWANVTIL